MRSEEQSIICVFNVQFSNEVFTVKNEQDAKKCGDIRRQSFTQIVLKHVFSGKVPPFGRKRWQCKNGYSQNRRHPAHSMRHGINHSINHSISRRRQA